MQAVGKKQSVVKLNGKSYNYRVDEPGRRLWLEDTESKLQWQWLGAEAKPLEGEDVMPETVALDAIKCLFAGGSGNCRAQLVETGNGGLCLSLRLPVRDTMWSVKRVFDLEPIAMNDSKLTLAQQLEIRKMLVDVKRQFEMTQNQQVASHKVITEKIQRVDNIADSISVIIVIYITSMAIVAIYYAFA